jgi:ABC-type antimicrobial peptide transport system permease subunit
MLSTFSLSALILAAIGLYGLLWYLVVERRRELGIRLALGAPRGKVITLVLRQGVALTATGLLVGAVSAYLLSGAVSGFLFEVSPFDLATFGAITIVLAGASIAASFLPAYRSTKVDPLTAIRYD